MNNHWIKEEIKTEINLETSENENTTYQNLWDAAKAVLRGEFVVVNAYIKKRREISNPQANFIPHRTKKKKNKLNSISRRKEITNISVVLKNRD